MINNLLSSWTTAAPVVALLLLSPPRCAAADEPARVHMKFIGAGRSAALMPKDAAPVQSRFLTRNDGDPATRDSPVAPVAWYHEIYPGIDLVCFADDYNVEYAFVVAPGGDTSLIRFGFEEPVELMDGHGGSVIIQTPGSRMEQGAPQISVVTEDGARTVRGRTTIVNGKTLRLDMAGALRDRTAMLNGTQMNVVPADGQPGGPIHTFYAAKLETTNEQFVRFLNDAQTDLRGPRGANMFFDGSGNVWINPEMKAGRDELFSIAAGRLAYDPTKPAGSRYSHWRPDDRNDPFADHPVTGVSWFGAVKYANWLTITAGRGIAERCYTEGTNALDWAPVTATNWHGGRFSGAERQIWLASRGFRLPMINGDTPAVTTNRFNEFYKAAAWNGRTNTLYGFGRDEFDGADANALTNAAQHVIGTTPAGYFNGETFLGAVRTRANANIYGLLDMSGNAAEWSTDFAREGLTPARSTVGGSFKDRIEHVYRCAPRPPHTTGDAVGFRVFTTYMPAESLNIHILYSFYTGIAETTTVIQTTEEIRLEQPGEVAAGVEILPGGANLIPPPISYKNIQEPPPPVIPEPSEEPNPPPVTPPGPVRRFTLTVYSTNPNSGINVTVNPADVSARSGDATPAVFVFNEGTAVNLTAPLLGGSPLRRFIRWRRTGFPDDANLTVGLIMDQDITMIADYGPVNLGVTLRFTVSPIDITDPIGTAYLIATPAGGTPPYINYEYAYVLAHHVTYTNWQSSVMVGATNTFDWDYSIKYRVRVQDSTLLWSPWAEANLVVLFTIPPDPITQIGL